MIDRLYALRSAPTQLYIAPISLVVSGVMLVRNNTFRHHSCMLVRK